MVQDLIFPYEYKTEGPFEYEFVKIVIYYKTNTGKKNRAKYNNLNKPIKDIKPKPTFGTCFYIDSRNLAYRRD